MIRSLVQKIENAKINLLTGLLIASVIAYIRVHVENTLLPPPILNIYVYAHEVLFFLTAFIAGTLIMSVLSRQDVRRVFKVVLSGFWIIILPPLIDFYLFSRRAAYDYAPTTDFIKNLSTCFFRTTYAGNGLIIEGFLIIIFSSLYVFFKSKSVTRTLINAISFYILIILAAIPQLYFYLPQKPLGFFAFLPAEQNYRRLLYFTYYLLTFFILGAFVLYKIDKKIVPNLLKNVRPFRSFHAMLMTFVGMVIAKGFTSLHFPDAIFSILSVLTIFFCWQFTLIINDIFDLGIDRISNLDRPLVKGIISKIQYLQIGNIFALLALITSFLIGKYTGYIVLIIFFFALIYSVPPLRLRKSVINTCFIGLGSALAYLLGYFTNNFDSAPSIEPRAILIGLLILFGLSLGPIVKDLKDYKGDRESGVRTIFTVFGLRKGKIIASVLLFLTFVLPITLIHSTLDIVVLSVAAISSTIYFYRKEKVPTLIVVSSLIIVYCLLRLTGHISP